MPEKQVLEQMGLKQKDLKVCYRGKGCEECKFTGYHGRTGIFELLTLLDPIREMILEKTGANVIRQKAMQLGLRNLREDGWDKVKRGITTIEEILRVTREEELVGLMEE